MFKSSFLKKFKIGFDCDLWTQLFTISCFFHLGSNSAATFARDKSSLREEPKEKEEEKEGEISPSPEEEIPGRSSSFVTCALHTVTKLWSVLRQRRGSEGDVGDREQSLTGRQSSVPNFAVFFLHTSHTSHLLGAHFALFNG